MFLRAFKERIGEEIKPDYLMSDDDPKYHNAWTTVMGNTPRRVLGMCLARQEKLDNSRKTEN